MSITKKDFTRVKSALSHAKHALLMNTPGMKNNSLIECVRELESIVKDAKDKGVY